MATCVVVSMATRLFVVVVSMTAGVVVVTTGVVVIRSAVEKQNKKYFRL